MATGYSGGVIASGVITTNALGQATLTYPNPGYVPKIFHQPWFVIGLTLYVILPEVHNTTTLQVRVWSLGIVTLLAVPLIGVAPAVGQPVFLEVGEPDGF